MLELCAYENPIVMQVLSPELRVAVIAYMWLARQPIASLDRPYIV